MKADTPCQLHREAAMAQQFSQRPPVPLVAGRSRQSRQSDLVLVLVLVLVAAMLNPLPP